MNQTQPSACLPAIQDPEESCDTGQQEDEHCEPWECNHSKGANLPSFENEPPEKETPTNESKDDGQEEVHKEEDAFLPDDVEESGDTKSDDRGENVDDDVVPPSHAEAPEIDDSVIIGGARVIELNEAEIEEAAVDLGLTLEEKDDLIKRFLNDGEDDAAKIHKYIEELESLHP